MKKIVKISMLALLGLGLAGCSSSDYDGINPSGEIASYLRILEDIRNNEYEIDLESRQEAVDFVKTISKADLENIESIDYSKNGNGYVVLIKFKKHNQTILLRKSKKKSSKKTAKNIELLSKKSSKTTSFPAATIQSRSRCAFAVTSAAMRRRPSGPW